MDATETHCAAAHGRCGIAPFWFVATLAVALAVIASTSRAQPLLDEVHTLSRAAPAVERSFPVTTAGGYDLQLTDNAFPAAFTSLRLIVTRGTQIVAQIDAPGSTHFDALVGNYQVHVLGSPNAATGSGSFGVRVVPTGSASPILDFADAINAPATSGDPTIMTLQTQFSVTAAGTYNAALTDFAFPASLSALTINIVGPSGSSVFLSPPSAPGTYSFTAVPGTYDLFVITKVQSPPDSGSYGLEIGDGTHVVYSDARAVSTQTSAGTPSATFAANVTVAGTYRVTLTDFQFPAPLQSVQLDVTQGGASLGTLAMAGTLDVTAAVGRVYISVIALPTPADGNGLYGVLFASAAGGTPVLDVTQGAGPLFDARTIDVTQAGSYDVILTDVNFPAPFTGLSLAVTRGTERPALIFGGGRFTLNATPGRYFLNFVAVPNATTKAGTYGLTVDATPPAPVVTLSANPMSVASGTTTSLTWSTTDATSCTASGAWSGSKTTSGSETSAALTSGSAFTLTCNGPGGSGSKTVNVGITAPAGSGGGGSFGVAELTLLAGGLLLGARRRHSLYICKLGGSGRSAGV